MEWPPADDRARRALIQLLRSELAALSLDPDEVSDVDAALTALLGLADETSRQRGLRRLLHRYPTLERWAADRAARGSIEEQLMSARGVEGRPARYLTAQHPEAVTVGLPFGVEVSITTQAYDRSALCRPFAIPDSGADLQLFVIAGTGLLVEEPSLHVVRVPPDTDSERRLFTLRAVAPGQHTLTVRAYLGGQPVGELSTLVDAGSAATELVRTVSAGIPVVEAGPNELTLQITRHGSGYDCRLFFAGRGDDLPAGLVDVLPDALVGAIRAEIVTIAAGRSPQRDPRMVLRDLEALGYELWTAALPDPVRVRLAELLDAADSLLILTDEHYDIPWELLLPRSGPAGDRPFLADRLPIVRRINGQSYDRQVRIRDAVYVQPSAPPGGHSDLELEMVQELLGDRVRHELPAITSTLKLDDYLRAGAFDLLHLAGHNDDTPGKWPRIVFPDGQYRSYHVGRAVARDPDRPALAERGPLIFFNACRTERGRPNDTHLRGWAESFLRGGAGALVGSTWSIRSESALRYATAFYTAFVAEQKTLGDAGLAARHALLDHDPADPTRLAYAVYGNVGMTATRGGR